MLLRHPFLAIFSVALLESMLLAKVGQWIGWGPTILLIMATAMLGSVMLRQQGFQTLRRLQATLARGESPSTELLEGALILLGGLLLITPGFITDAVGFLLLLPPSRLAIIRLIASRLPQASGPTIVQDSWTYSYRAGPQQERDPDPFDRDPVYREPRQHDYASPGTPHDPTVIEGEFSRKED